MREPTFPVHVRRNGSNTPVTTAKGCIIRRRPTSPLEFARPSGNGPPADASSSRAVPIAFAARTTTSASERGASRRHVDVLDPRHQPALPGDEPHDPRAGHDARSSAIAWASASGRWTPLHPPGSPACRCPTRRTDACLVGQGQIAHGAGHQCQPRRSCARTTSMMPSPSGSGGTADPPLPGTRDRRPTRHSDLARDPVVVRLELLVGERPVVGDAVQRAHPEVRGRHPRPITGVEDHRPTDAVEHERNHVGRVRVDRVVRPSFAGPFGSADQAAAPAAPSPAAGRDSRHGRATRPAPGRATRMPASARRFPDNTPGGSRSDDQDVGPLRAHDALAAPPRRARRTRGRRLRSSRSSRCHWTPSAHQSPSDLDPFRDRTGGGRGAKASAQPSAPSRGTS